MPFSLKHILVVDDNLSILCLFREIFKQDGYTIETATSGLEAIEKIKSCIPDLVLLDVKMPKMNGFQTLELIQQIEPSIPVVMMSAYTELTSVMACREQVGVSHYLPKPFELQEVRDLIGKFTVKKIFKENILC